MTPAASPWLHPKNRGQDVSTEGLHPGLHGVGGTLRALAISVLVSTKSYAIHMENMWNTCGCIDNFINFMYMYIYI